MLCLGGQFLTFPGGTAGSTDEEAQEQVLVAAPVRTRARSCLRQWAGRGLACARTPVSSVSPGPRSVPTLPPARVDMHTRAWGDVPVCGSPWVVKQTSFPGSSPETSPGQQGAAFQLLFLVGY